MWKPLSLVPDCYYGFDLSLITKSFRSSNLSVSMHLPPALRLLVSFPPFSASRASLKCCYVYFLPPFPHLSSSIHSDTVCILITPPEKHVPRSSMDSIPANLRDTFQSPSLILLCKHPTYQSSLKPPSLTFLSKPKFTLTRIHFRLL